ncbi:MAG: type II secretion system F family protein [Gammaproteobacteria bacterium]|nr:type II secretion system F family protein [Gammaproteobacteria bacterium]
MELAQVSDFIGGLGARWKHLRFGAKAQLAFLEDFYLLVNDGIPANHAIEMVADATTGITRDVALSIAQKISEGQPLAEGMRDWFNTNIVEIIRVGEQGGALVETLKSAINTLGRSSGAMGAFLGAILYPTMVITIACVIILYLDGSVFLQFAAIKKQELWPQAGRDLVATAAFIRHWWWMCILGVIGFVYGLMRLMSDYIGEYRATLDKFPPFSLYKKFVSARFMETLGLLVANGIVFKNALKVMQYRATPYLTSHLVNMEHLLSTGKGNIADILMTGLIDEKDVLRLRVMAEVKGFEHGLVRMGVRGAENSVKTLKIISKIFGGALMVVGAYLIITIVRGIYLTGMSMGQQ